MLNREWYFLHEILESELGMTFLTRCAEITLVGYRWTGWHNFHRKKYSAQDLIWDANLASQAQQVANTCVFEHSKHVPGKTPLGEVRAFYLQFFLKRKKMFLLIYFACYCGIVVNRIGSESVCRSFQHQSGIRSMGEWSGWGWIVCRGSSHSFTFHT